MRKGDTQLGTPYTEYVNTKANIEALTGIATGAISYASDTLGLGNKNAVGWSWITNPTASTLALAITAGKTLTLTAANDYNLTAEATGIIALLNRSGGQTFTTNQSIVGSTDSIQLKVKANATQTTNLQEWQNSSGTVLGSVSGGGSLGVGGINTAYKVYAANLSLTNPASISGGAFSHLTFAYTDATTQVAVYGHRVYVQYAGATQDYTTGAIGISGEVYNATSQTMSVLAGLSFTGGNLGSGTITTLRNAQLTNYSTGGTITNMTSLDVLSGSGGTIVNHRGLSIGNLRGTTLNRAIEIASQTGIAAYAIYTNTGLVHFGDTVDLASGKNLTLLAGNITTDTTTGTKIGTATTQKLGFFNATPIVQPSSGNAIANLNSLGLTSGATLKLTGAVYPHSCTYISGTGTAGADGTAQTVKTVSLTANSLTQVGDRLRIRVYWRGDTGAPITATVQVNSVTVSAATDSGTSSYFVTECYLHYIDSTHANILENGSYPATGANTAANVAGFAWTSAQNIDVLQNNVVENHIVVLAVIVDIFPKGV